jgi:hypothetical protein
MRLPFSRGLKAAITAAGIDRQLPHRRLIIVRTEPLSTGVKTQKSDRSISECRWTFLEPSDSDIQTLQALKQLMSAPTPESLKAGCRPGDRYQACRRLMTLSSGFLAGTTANVMDGSETVEPAVQKDVDGGDVLSLRRSTKKQSPVSALAESGDELLPIGRQIDRAAERNGVVTIPTRNLTKHAVILAGSGSGKTVLVKRIVEEALLQGIPSIVIDGAEVDLRPWLRRPLAAPSLRPGWKKISGSR